MFVYKNFQLYKKVVTANKINNFIRAFSSSQDVNSVKEIRITKKITQDELNSFSRLTGDTNPIHSEGISEDKRLVHGALLNGIVAGIIGTKLPGPGTVVVSQSYKFPNQCRINKDIEILVKLVEERKIMKVYYECKQSDQVVFQGDAKLIRMLL